MRVCSTTISVAQSSGPLRRSNSAVQFNGKQADAKKACVSRTGGAVHYFVANR